eukprot:4319360-Ditylum_brightwellii.AAC.1
MKNDGKTTQSILNFLVPRNDVVDVTVAVQKATPCPGICDEKYHPGLLQLMTMYGKFGNVGVQIMTTNNTTIAFMHDCVQPLLIPTYVATYIQK